MPITAAVILQLLVTFGPGAIELIQKLVATWTVASLTPAQVDAILAPLLTKSTADYLASAGATSRPTN